MSKLVRYSDKDLDEFKVLIEDKLEKANKELQYLQSQVSEAASSSGNQKGGDYSDDSSRHTEIEMLNNMATRQALFIRNLKNALLRIQNKTYGICTITGQLISKERLMVVPHATKTIAGKHDDIKKSNAKRSSIPRKNGSPKVKSKVVSKSVKKENFTPPPPDEGEDMILELEELPDDLIPKEEEGFNDSE